MPEPRILRAASVKVGPARRSLDPAEEARRTTEAAVAAAAHAADVAEAYEAGRADGAEAAGAAHTQAIAHLSLAVENAAAAHTEAIGRRHAEDAAVLAAAGAEIARWILARELATDPMAAVSRIEAAMAQLAPTSRLRVVVNPSLVDVLAGWASGRDVDLSGDATLAAGEARLENGHAAADLTFAEAVRRIVASLDDESDEAVIEGEAQGADVVNALGDLA